MSDSDSEVSIISVEEEEYEKGTSGHFGEWVFENEVLEGLQRKIDDYFEDKADIYAKQYKLKERTVDGHLLINLLYTYGIQREVLGDQAQDGEINE